MDALTTTFAALADPTRRAILMRLAKGDATVNELAEPFEMKLPSVSKHLKVLEHAGLISRSKEAQFRRCHLEGARLKEAHEWVFNYRELWEESFDRLAELFGEQQQQQQPQQQQQQQQQPDKKTKKKKGRVK
jgi:DNA-binding transcriptional ArsR family regulator